MTLRIGLIGIGMMGHGIAKNLVTKGFPLTLNANRNRSTLGEKTCFIGRSTGN